VPRPMCGVVPVGPDLGRGWGQARTVAEDFLFDSPGVWWAPSGSGPTWRTSGRVAGSQLHLRHLYAPQQEVSGSLMPPFRFLFETRRIERAPPRTPWFCLRSSRPAWRRPLAMRLFRGKERGRWLLT